MTADMPPLWHVTLHVSGAAAPDSQLARALQRLCEQDPGNMAARYGSTAAELQFWDEAPDMEQAARSAVDLWQRVRGHGGLPEWALVGLDVADLALWRQQQEQRRRAIAPGSVAPQR